MAAAAWPPRSSAGTAAPRSRSHSRSVSQCQPLCAGIYETCVWIEMTPLCGTGLSEAMPLQVCAVLQAVLDVVASQGMQPTPTAIFAAVMSSLDRPATQASAEVLLCSLSFARSPLCVRRTEYPSACLTDQLTINVVIRHWRPLY